MLAEDRTARDEFLAGLTDEEAFVLLYQWSFWARPDQLPPPGDWTTWLLLGGRGAGKTRAGAEFIIGEVEAKRAGRIALIGRDAGDVRDVLVEGESGILASSPPWNFPKYEPSKKRLTWPNGARATLFSAEDPDALRGPQHDLAWGDELAAWQYARETWDNIQFGLRIGDRPRQIVTTTPRPIPVLKEIVADATGETPHTIISRASTYANKDNLAPAFLSSIIKRYENTRLGRQELEGHLLEDVAGALWTRDMLDKGRVINGELVKFRDAKFRDEFFTRIVVAVDPPASSTEGADECGIVVCGLGSDKQGYVLADFSKGQLSPQQWAQRAVDAYREFDADMLVAEANQGGEMVKTVIQAVDSTLRYKPVHAYRGKALRAEPVALKYEQGLVHHVGTFAQLEDQQCVMTLDYDAAKMGSPDRLDACVHALTELMLGRPEMVFG